MDWKTIASTVFIGAAVLIGLPAFAQEPVAEYTPSGPWTVDYADDSCALLRSFSDGEHDVWMEVRRIAPSGQSRFMVGSGHLQLTSRDPHITIFPQREPFERGLQTLTSDDDSVRAFVTTVSTSDFEAGSHRVWRDEPVSQWETEERPPIEGIQIASVFDRTVILRTGEMDSALAALETCMEDLVRTWGIEPEELARSETPPLPVDMDRWVSRVVRHYPRTGFRRTRNTSFPVVLLVGPDGMVARCRSPNALGDEDFEAVACAALMEYARFEPARDADGQPAYGFWFTNMVYSAN